MLPTGMLLVQKIIQLLDKNRFIQTDQFRQRGENDERRFIKEKLRHKTIKCPSRVVSIGESLWRKRGDRNRLSETNRMPTAIADTALLRSPDKNARKFRLCPNRQNETEGETSPPTPKNHTIMANGNSSLFGFAYYAGDPNNAGVTSFNVAKGTIVVDGTNGNAYKKILALGTNTSGFDELVGAIDTQTLTNKTLTSPIITGATNSGGIDSDTKVLAASITYDAIPAAATITGFSWTVVAAGVYVFDVELATTMTTTGGLAVNFKLTTATLTSIRYNTYASTAVDNSTAVSSTGTTTTDATKPFDSKTAAYTRVRIFGSVVVNAGGTFAWQATQNTTGTGGDVTIILIGSTARLTRVA